jgi:capsule polysaccharide export protein KpsC/LpsZ
MAKKTKVKNNEPLEAKLWKAAVLIIYPLYFHPKKKSKNTINFLTLSIKRY